MSFTISSADDKIEVKSCFECPFQKIKFLNYTRLKIFICSQAEKTILRTISTETEAQTWERFFDVYNGRFPKWCPFDQEIKRHFAADSYTAGFTNPNEEENDFVDIFGEDA
jgi:hypothetical protein